MLITSEEILTQQHGTSQCGACGLLCYSQGISLPKFVHGNRWSKRMAFSSIIWSLNRGVGYKSLNCGTSLLLTCGPLIQSRANCVQSSQTCFQLWKD